MSDEGSESHKNFSELSEDEIKDLVDLPTPVEEEDEPVRDFAESEAEAEKRKKDAEDLENTKKLTPGDTMTKELLAEVANDFLRHYTKKVLYRSKKKRDEIEKEVNFYVKRIGDMVPKRNALLIINFRDIMDYRNRLIDREGMDKLIYALTNHPYKVRKIFTELVKQIFMETFGDEVEDSTAIKEIYKMIQVGFTQFQDKPTQLNELRTQYLSKFGTVEGVISQFDEVPRVKILESVWNCSMCNAEYKQAGGKKPTKCVLTKDCTSRQFEQDLAKQKNEDFLDIRLTQQYGGVQKNNTVDRYVRLSGTALVNHTLNHISPGQVVTVNGVYVLAEKTGLKDEDENGDIEIDGFAIEQKNVVNLFDYNERLLTIVRDYINEKNIQMHVEKLKRSVCAHLYGQEPIKFAVLLMMIGTNPRRRPDGTREKGDINVLNCGNSGTGKSDYSTYIQNVIPHSIKAGTKGGTSVAGLTTFVDRNPKTGKSVVSLGVLAMTDMKGIALIEEINRRNKKDLDEFANATDDNQQILVNKGGFHSIIYSRCPIYATANSLNNNGVWDDTQPISKQTNIDSFILSRMDLVFVSHMERNEEYKRKIMSHIQNDYDKSILEKDYNHIVESKNNVEYTEGILKQVEVKLRQNDFTGIYPVEYMRHEIHYLKSIDCKLVKDSPAYKLLSEFWISYSSTSAAASSMALSDELTRSLEAEVMDIRKFTSLRKISEAIGRLYRSPTVLKEHAQMAIELMSLSIASTIPNSSGMSVDEQDEYAKKMLDKATAKGIVNQMAIEKQQKRNRYFNYMAKLLNRFNDILYRQGYDMCKTCHGTGSQSEIVDSESKKIETHECADCGGEGGFLHGFTYNDFEANILNNGMIDERTCRIFWKVYDRRGFIRVQNSLFYLDTDLKSPDAVDAIKAIANNMTDVYMENEERKEAMASMNQKPLFRRGDEA